MKEIPCEQGESEWFQARRGIPTASEFSRIGFTSVIPAGALAKYEAELGAPFKVKSTKELGAFVEITKAAAKKTAISLDWKKLVVMKDGATRFATAETEAMNRTYRKLTDGAQSYISELWCESIGYVKESDLKEDGGGFKSIHTQRGDDLEPLALAELACEIEEPIRKPGFILSDCGRYGASPDGLTEAGIPCEAKCPDWPKQKKAIQFEGGEVPEEHLAQIDGEMIVTGAPYAWFIQYTVSPKIPNIIAKVEWSERTDALKADVESFCDILDEMKA